MQIGDSLRTLIVEPLELPVGELAIIEPEPSPFSRTPSPRKYPSPCEHSRHILPIVAYRVWQWDSLGLKLSNGFRAAPWKQNARLGYLWRTEHQGTDVPAAFTPRRILTTCGPQPIHPYELGRVMARTIDPNSIVVSGKTSPANTTHFLSASKRTSRCISVIPACH